MNKFNFYSLHFAANEKFEDLIKLRNKICSNFEMAKFNKHSKIGKTTSHRCGKKEKKLAQIRNKARKIGYILMYKKIIKNNPDILKNLENYKITISLEDWLNI